MGKIFVNKSSKFFHVSSFYILVIPDDTSSQEHVLSTIVVLLTEEGLGGGYIPVDCFIVAVHINGFFNWYAIQSFFNCIFR